MQPQKKFELRAAIPVTSKSIPGRLTRATPTAHRTGSRWGWESLAIRRR